MKYIMTIFLTLLSPCLFAEEGFPAGCKPAAVKDDPFVLKSTKLPELVLVHNLSNSEIWVTHPVTDPSASAGWSSKLQGGNWSALTLQSDTFELSCIESKPGHEQQVPCAGLLAVCQWSGIKMPTGDGTYWAGEDLSLTALKEHLSGRGFVLPTTP